MQGRRNPFVAQEGIPFLLLSGLASGLALRYLDYYWFAAALLLFVAIFLVFRDPRRSIPAVPLGVVSPVDGRVVEVGVADKEVLQGEAHRIVLRINSFGTYTARCPVEGKVMDLNSLASERIIDYKTNALWVQTDEGDDVVLQFGGYRFGLPPQSFVRYGERVGQGSRCAYLRLTRFAELHLPIDSKVQVAPGQRVAAGRDVLAKLRQR